MPTGAFLAAALLLLCAASSVSAADVYNGAATDAGSIGRRGLLEMSESKLAIYCAKTTNQASAKCVNWAKSHEEFQDLEGKAAQLDALIADKSSEVDPAAGGRSAGTHWDLPRAHRMAKYASALRCKWSAVSKWNCTTCHKIANTVVLAAHEDAVKGHPDAFIITFDKELNAIVATFRSTYCAVEGCTSEQWLNNAIFVTKNVQLGDGKTYSIHSGFWDTWDGYLRDSFLAAMKDAVAAHPPSTHHGVFINGHSRGGAFANLAAQEVFFHAERLGLTDPKNQVKLYTMGSPRVGNQAFAKLIEDSFAARFRITSNADIVTSVAPRAWDWLFKIDYLLGDLLKHGISEHSTELSQFTHFGPQVQVTDYIVDLPFLDPVEKKDTKICHGGEDDACRVVALTTIAFDRPWEDSVFTRVGLDHGHYLGEDMDNENCKYHG